MLNYIIFYFIFLHQTKIFLIFKKIYFHNLVKKLILLGKRKVKSCVKKVI